MLIESVVRNFENEHQTITIEDLNNGMVITILTMPRGLARHWLHCHSGHHSINGLGANSQVVVIMGLQTRAGMQVCVRGVWLRVHFKVPV